MYMPEFYSYFRKKREVDVIQYKLDKHKQEFEMEVVILEKIKHKGISDGFPLIISTLSSELDNLAEIMVTNKGRNLFTEFNLIQSLRNPHDHIHIDSSLINQVGRDIVGYLEVFHSLGYVHANLKP